MTRLDKIRGDHTIEGLGITDIEGEIGGRMIIEGHVSMNVCPSESKINTSIIIFIT